MKTTLIFSLTLIVILLTSCSQSTDDGEALAVYGIALDENGNPVADADVCVIPDIPTQFKFFKDDNDSKNSNPKLLVYELVNFNTSFDFNRIEIKWVTATEVNTDRFELEKSINDKNQWNKIASIKAAGKSSIARNYYTSDSNIEYNSVYHYRLKMIDTDGSYSYSHESVITTTDTNFSLSHNSPNPFTNYTSINFINSKDTNVIFEIVEKSTGKTYLLDNNLKKRGTWTISWDAKNTESSDSTRPLRPGVYVAKVTMGEKSLTQNMILGFKFSTSNCLVPLEVTKTDKDGRFVIPYNWFPDVQEALRTAVDGRALGKFQYGQTANIIIRKELESNATQNVYLVSQNNINVDKNKVLNLNYSMKKYNVNK
ncbi:MAG: Fibronectin type domain protein [Ignavibacteria bacterium]|nr:Fibronectin type domain protein [Ignavibacteria bacterium]